MREKTTRQVERRSFLKTAMGGAAVLLTLEDQIAFASQAVNRNSRPSELKITDLRTAVIKDAPMRCPVIRIDTNQGISGWGEVRDGADKRYALFLKSRILGENPCNVERIFKKIKQFAGHARQGGGVSGVEMALWDLAGKAYGVPVYMLLGGKYRDKIRVYCDTVSSDDPKAYAEHMKERVAAGFTWLKMDLGINLLRGKPNTLTQPLDLGDISQIQHPFTGIEITDKGVQMLADYVAAIRESVGYELPLAADHFGHIGVNSCIRLGKALQGLQMAWLEDLIPWQFTDLWKQITDEVDVPTLTGEDIFGKEDFAKLVDAKAVDIIHPDLATAGGILETKKIGDYAQERGVAMAMHFAGTPISCMANVHCAAATQNFLALENHSVDVPWWSDLANGPSKPIVQRGYIPVPETPGLGVELNDEVAKQHLAEPDYFGPTTDWDKPSSWDRLWS